MLRDKAQIGFSNCIRDILGFYSFFYSAVFIVFLFNLKENDTGFGILPESDLEPWPPAVVMVMIKFEIGGIEIQGSVAGKVLGFNDQGHILAFNAL